jgi:hypothetical protein
MAAAAGSSTNKVTNFVGKVVNGFEIQKLIGKSLPVNTTPRPRQVQLRV